MNFFKSVFLDDQESSDLETHQRPISESPTKSIKELEKEEGQGGQLVTEAPLDEIDSDQNPSPKFSDGNYWSFGGLIKTFASKSESVLETYRRDLEDFSSGLKKETATIREVASRVVKELPVKFEAGTTVAQESLESVGQAIDDIGSSVWRGTAEIISQGKETLLSADVEGDSSDNQQFTSPSLSSKRYNRFEAQLYGIQSDLNTYCEDPEDLVDFNNWKSGFVLGEKSEEIENLLGENEVLERIYTRIVPSEVDDGTFWFRYFYRVYKLKQVEDARANLVKRAISGEEEEDLSWDVDDDEEEEETNSSGLKDDSVENKQSEMKVIEESQSGNYAVVKEIGEKSSEGEGIENKGLIAESVSENQSEEKGVSEGKTELAELSSNDLATNLDEKLVLQGKSEMGESGKDSDISVVSSRPSSHDEEDLSWDEIEHLGNNDEKKVTVGGRAGLGKRLNIADEDEDLSWDIEDDDEDVTVKS
ncbi:BSD [Macleaya cordata]|uniref:BSD n=1 Tax=Macleaya cordata TaxID=56857 RepID=A0A200RBL4_MACCD|nr:BSD [Macleaya cordata]